MSFFGRMGSDEVKFNVQIQASRVEFTSPQAIEPILIKFIRGKNFVKLGPVKGKQGTYDFSSQQPQSIVATLYRKNGKFLPKEAVFQILSVPNGERLIGRAEIDLSRYANAFSNAPSSPSTERVHSEQLKLDKCADPHAKLFIKITLKATNGNSSNESRSQMDQSASVQSGRVSQSEESKHKDESVSGVDMNDFIGNKSSKPQRKVDTKPKPMNRQQNRRRDDSEEEESEEVSEESEEESVSEVHRKPIPPPTKNRAPPSNTTMSNKSKQQLSSDDESEEEDDDSSDSDDRIVVKKPLPRSNNLPVASPRKADSQPSPRNNSNKETSNQDDLQSSGTSSVKSKMRPQREEKVREADIPVSRDQKHKHLDDSDEDEEKSISSVVHSDSDSESDSSIGRKVKFGNMRRSNPTRAPRSPHHTSSQPVKSNIKSVPITSSLPTPPVKPISPSQIFSCSIAEAMTLNPRGSKLPIPFILDILLKSLERSGGLETEGIFRISVPTDVREATRRQFENGDYKLITNDPNVFASIIKYWLSSTQDSVIPESLYEKCISIGKSNVSMQNQHSSGKDVKNKGNEEKGDPSVLILKRELATVASELPSTNRAIFVRLLTTLRAISSPPHAAKSRMSTSSLAVCFAPCLIRLETQNAKQHEIMMKAQYCVRFVEHALDNVDIFEDESNSFLTSVPSVEAASPAIPISTQQKPMPSKESYRESPRSSISSSRSPSSSVNKNPVNDRSSKSPTLPPLFGVKVLPSVQPVVHHGKKMENVPTREKLKPESDEDDSESDTSSESERSEDEYVRRRKQTLATKNQSPTSASPVSEQARNSKHATNLRDAGKRQHVVAQSRESDSDSNSESADESSSDLDPRRTRKTAQMSPPAPTTPSPSENQNVTSKHSLSPPVSPAAAPELESVSSESEAIRSYEAMIEKYQQQLSELKSREEQRNLEDENKIATELERQKKLMEAENKQIKEQLDEENKRLKEKAIKEGERTLEIERLRWLKSEKEMRQEIDKLRKSEADSQTQLTKRMDEIVALKLQLKKLEAGSNQQAQSNDDQLNKKILVLTNELSRTRENHAQTEQMLGDAQQEVGHLRSELQQKENTIKQLNETIAQQSAELNELHVYVHVLQSNAENAVHGVLQVVQTEQKDRPTSFAAAKLPGTSESIEEDDIIEDSDLESESDDNDKIVYLKDKSRSLLKRLRRKTIELKKLKKSSSSDGGRSTGQLASTTKELTKYIERIRELESSVESLDLEVNSKASELEDLKHQLKAKDLHLTELIKERQINLNVSTPHKELENPVASSNEDTEDLQRLYSEQKVLTEKLSRSVEKLEREKFDLNALVAQKNREIEEFLESQMEATMSKSTLIDDEDDFDEQRWKSLSEREKLKQFVLLRQNIQGKVKELSLLAMRIEQLEKENRDIRETMTQRLHAKDEEMQWNGTRTDELTEEIASLKLQLKRDRNIPGPPSYGSPRTSRELGRLIEEKRMLETKLRDTEDKLRESESRADELDDQLAATIAEFERKDRLFVDRTSSSSSSISDSNHKDTIKQLKEQITTLHDEKKRLEVECKGLNRELEHILDNQSSPSSALSSRQQKGSDNIQSISPKTDPSSAVIQSQFEIYRGEMQSKINHERELVRTLKLQLETAGREISLLRSERAAVDDWNKEIEEFRSKKKHDKQLQTLQAALEGAYEQSLRRISFLEQQVRECDEVLESAKQTWRVSSAVLEDEVERLQQELKTLQQLHNYEFELVTADGSASLSNLEISNRAQYDALLIAMSRLQHSKNKLAEKLSHTEDELRKNEQSYQELRMESEKYKEDVRLLKDDLIKSGLALKTIAENNFEMKEYMRLNTKGKKEKN